MDSTQGSRCRSASLVGVALIMCGVMFGCSASSSKLDTAARDRCEQRAGVGRCLLRKGKWEPIGSRDGTTSTIAATTNVSTTTSTIAPTTATSVAVTSVSAPVPVKPSNVLGEPAGLYCRDLKGRSYSYTAAFDYWRAHGEPDQMDADRNGIPCETVFTRSDVTAYWGLQPSSPPTDGLPSGLSCNNLYTAGYSYPVAVAYWYYEGVPARMDIDGNGIPCETVYPASIVNSFWYG